MPHRTADTAASATHLRVYLNPNGGPYVVAEPNGGVAGENLTYAETERRFGRDVLDSALAGNTVYITRR
jgi:hypothetical protein